MSSLGPFNTTSQTSNSAQASLNTLFHVNDLFDDPRDYFNLHTSQIKPLLDKGAVADANMLEKAALNCALEVVVLLVESGVPATTQALLYAAYGSRTDVVKFLHQKGASFDDAILTATLKKDRPLAEKLTSYKELLENKTSENTIAELREQVRQLTEQVTRLTAASSNANSAGPKPDSTNSPASPGGL